MNTELTKLREALHRVKSEAVSLADAQVIALEALTTSQPAQAGEVNEAVAWPCSGCANHPSNTGDTEKFDRFIASPPTQPAAQATPATPDDMKVYDGIAADYFAETQQATPDVPETGFGNMATQQATPEPVGEPVAVTNERELALLKKVGGLGTMFPPDTAGFHVKLYTHPAPGVPEGWREVIEKMVKGIDHLAELARQWEPDYSSGADRKGWVLAKNARDEAVDMLAAAQAKGGEHG